MYVTKRPTDVFHLSKKNFDTRNSEHNLNNFYWVALRSNFRPVNRGRGIWKGAVCKIKDHQHDNVSILLMGIYSYPVLSII